MKLAVTFALSSLLVVGDWTAAADTAEASTGYAGYIRCEDLKVKDLVPLRSKHTITLKANTTFGSTTVDKKAAFIADETKTVPAQSFGVPAMKTHAYVVMGPSTAGYELSVERLSKDSAELDVTVCVSYERLSPDGSEQKSETAGQASLLAGQTQQVVWQKKSLHPEGHVYTVLVQPRSVNTSTSYRIGVKRNSSWR